MTVNWDKVEKCNLWEILGVTECENCESLIDCWGEDSQLPEPEHPLTENDWSKILKQKNE